ncbi:unnamed protein product [Dimorphilus gyrociliatus]|nr:unnamed protein product [Dimorphilus gyrociliatus]
MSSTKVKFKLPKSNNNSLQDIDKLIEGKIEQETNGYHNNDSRQVKPYTLHINPGLGSHLSEKSWTTLTQAKLVYDGLLADRCYRLDQKLLGKKAYFDEKINKLLKKDSQKNEVSAMETAVKGQYQLHLLQETIIKELTDMMKDYQNKLDLLTVSLLQTEKHRKDSKE